MIVDINAHLLLIFFLCYQQDPTHAEDNSVSVHVLSAFPDISDYMIDELDTKEEEIEVDYTKEENYKVDFFLGHKMGYNKTKRKKEMMLRTHWKGWESRHDTDEPITEKAEEEERLVLDYVKNCGDPALLKYIWSNRKTFPTSFVFQFTAYVSRENITV